MNEHTVWIVFSPGVRHHWRDCVFACPVQSIDQFVRNFGTVRMVEDRVTFYPFEHESAARMDAHARWVEARTVTCHHFCNNSIQCPTCNRRFWAWAQQHTHGRAPGRGPSFYEAAARFPPAPRRESAA